MVSAAGACGHDCHHKPPPWGSAAEPSGYVQNAADRHRGSALGLSQRAEAPTWGLPSIRTLSGLLGSVLSDLRGTGGAAALILAHPLQSCPHRPPLHWDLTSTFLVPAPSQGIRGPLQLRGQGKQSRFVLSWRGNHVGNVLISSRDTCGLWCPGLPASLWAIEGPRLLSAPLLTDWSMF